MRNFISVVFLAIGLSGCAAQDSAQDTVKDAGVGVVDFSVLAGSWRLAVLEGQAWEGEPEVTMILSDTGRFSGTGGCNRYFGVFKLLEGKLSSGPVGSTMMACEQPAMDIEYRYLGLLEKVTRITRSDSLLHLLDEEGHELMQLGAAPSVE